jgi:hypothetical protein
MKEKSKAGEKEETGDEREDWRCTCSRMYGCSSHFTEGCQVVVGKRRVDDGD